MGRHLRGQFQLGSRFNHFIGAHRPRSVTYITHELYDVTCQLLVEGMLSHTLDQNARQHAVLTTDLLIRLLEQGLQPDMYQDGRVELRIVTAENLD